ncbi:hypothetical protein ACFPZL_04680 [Leucobacter soli]|uniref:Glycosyltransferase RgtA/B/C/D-like domain-containing protein n=1 Tax=Leucobacter soli TaxID=2812850 RepID=A0A916NFM0_9MICO|nr:hypothetical protein [Leucobacter soli]CAG7599367.1 hypothetical protein LEUCIP111803_00291 [Leucobacter soli]
MTSETQPIRAGWTSSRLVLAVTKHPVGFWAALIVVFALARLATWGYPFDSDHWIFYYVGHNWIVDGGDLYVDAWDHKPPMIFLMNGIMAALLGDSIVLHRIWLTAFAILECWLFYLLAKRVLPGMLDRADAADASRAADRPGSRTARIIDREVAVKLTLLAYVFFRNLSQFTDSGNNTEGYGVILVLLLVLAYLKFADTGRLHWLALAGLSCGVLFWFKGNFLIFGGIIGLLLLIHGWRTRGRAGGRLILQVVVYVAPIVLVALAWFAYFAARGTFDDFWLASFGFSALYATSAWAGKVSANILLIVTTAALMVPALILFVVYLRDIRAQWKSQSYQLVGAMFLAGYVLIGLVGSFYPYYLLITMPFTVLVMIFAMLRVSSLGKVWRVILIAGLVFTLVANYAISTRQLLNNFTGSAAVDAQQKMAAAEYIQEHTEPEERILSYDYGATFYQLAQRKAPSRFVSASVLLLDFRDGFGLGFNDEVIAGMEAHGVRYVMLSGINRELYETNTQMSDYLAEHFRTAETFGDVEVLERVDE